MIVSLVEAVLKILDGAISSSKLDSATCGCQRRFCANNRRGNYTENIASFQEAVAQPFTFHLKENISSRFESSHDFVSALAIFIPQKVPSADSVTLPTCSKKSIKMLFFSNEVHQNSSP